jgi:hypothetical protein
MSVYSVPDDRSFDGFPNNSINVQGTLTYTVHPTESRSQGAPKDSRVSKPIDSRLVSFHPQNSRKAPPF